VIEAIKIKYERPPLTDYQRRIFFHDKRYAFIEAMTKSGKTVGAMSWLLERAMHDRATNYYWVAPIFPQSMIAYERFKRGLPNELRHPKENPPQIELANNHLIWFKSGDDPDNLYGDDVGAAVLDEASRMKEEVFNAVRSTLTATGGPMRCIGNVKGRKNWFYKMCRKAEEGDPNAVFERITAEDAIAAGIISREEIEDARRFLSEQAFKELYYCEPSDDGGNPFGLDRIAACVTPLTNRSPVVYGIDLAKSVDWTVVIGLDALGYVCRFERWQSPWVETMQRIIAIVGKGRALIDSTGVGDPIVEQIQRKSSGLIEGIKFTRPSKQQLMEGLASSISQHTIHFPDGPIRSELESFEYHYSIIGGASTGVRYEAAEGMYDDCVCALALANQGFGSGNFRPLAAMTTGSLPQNTPPSWTRDL
jgi:phage FluMu gp28-like protein